LSHINEFEWDKSQSHQTNDCFCSPRRSPGARLSAHHLAYRIGTHIDQVYQSLCQRKHAVPLPQWVHVVITRTEVIRHCAGQNKECFILHPVVCTQAAFS
jgi:hypothetical protein